MRKHGRTDRNQQHIIDTLRQCGCSVVDLSSVGGGVPDLVIGVKGQTVLLEVKDGSKPPSKRKLTPAERTFFDEWRGRAYVVNSAEEALSVLGLVAYVT